MKTGDYCQPLHLMTSCVVYWNSRIMQIVCVVAVGVISQDDYNVRGSLS